MRLGENFSAGIKINYLFLDLGENYGSRSIFSADIGLNTQLILSSNHGSSAQKSYAIKAF